MQAHTLLCHKTNETTRAKMAAPVVDCQATLLVSRFWAEVVVVVVDMR